MSSSDVPGKEMYAEELTNKLMHELGDLSMPPAPARVHELVGDLLLECAATPMAEPNSSLAEFLHVTPLPQTAAAVPLGPRGARKC